MKHFNYLLIATAVIIVTSCASINLNGSSPFNIEDAKYTLYKGQEGNKGLIEFTLANPADDLMIESVIFNRLLIPTTSQSIDEEGNVLVTAKFDIPEDGNKVNYINKSNRLNYTVYGKNDFVQYTEIKKQPHPLILNW